VLADTGEDTLVICSACDYAANSEKAAVAPSAADETEMLPLEKVETPGKRKVSAVCEAMNIQPHELVKTMVYKTDNETVAVLVRGDREVQEVKLKNLLGAADVEMLDDKAVFDATGVPTGYLGPVGSSGRRESIEIVASIIHQFSRISHRLFLVLKEFLRPTNVTHVSSRKSPRLYDLSWKPK